MTKYPIKQEVFVISTLENIGILFFEKTNLLHVVGQLFLSTKYILLILLYWLFYFSSLF